MLVDIVLADRGLVAKGSDPFLPLADRRKTLRCNDEFLSWDFVFLDCLGDDAFAFAV